MWQMIVYFLCYVASQVIAQQINVKCNKKPGFPPTDVEASPSKVADLKLDLVMEGEEVKLNISWAINIDASIGYLTGTSIQISGEPDHLCEYDPPFAKANLTGSEQEWFHFLVRADPGDLLIRVTNIPFPPRGGGSSFLNGIIRVPRRSKPRVTTNTAYVTTDETFPEPTPSAVASTEPTPPAQIIYNVIVIVVGVMAALMLLSSFCICIYKNCRPVSATYLGVKNLPTRSVVSVPVLVVYPAVNSAFQRAVVALAEFLQLDGGCRVAIDMWQQGKIAEMGPLRWLVEQVNAADHVLIVAPQGDTSSSLVHSAPDLPEHSIPAAAHDLYPLILNMVASHAKSASELAKFWVVHLNRNSGVFLPELKACKSFYLIKDLDKLCKLLHTPRNVGKKISSMLFYPEISHSKNSTAKLKEAIGILGRGKQSVSRESLIDHL